MLMLSRSVRVFIAAEATDMRRSFDRLAEMTRQVIGQDPLAGHFFVFFNRPRGPRQDSGLGTRRFCDLVQAA